MSKAHELVHPGSNLTQSDLVYLVALHALLLKGSYPPGYAAVVAKEVRDSYVREVTS